MDEVKEASYKMSEELYKAAQASSSSQSAGGPGGSDQGDAAGGGASDVHKGDSDDVIDADFKTVD